MLPELGETITEGTIIRWLKQVGETVEMDELLYEISTDKVDSEVPSPAAGVLTKIVAAPGETVAVGEVLAVMSETAAVSETAESTEPTSSEAAGSSAAAANVQEGEGAEVEAPPEPPPPPPPAAPAPPADAVSAAAPPEPERPGAPRLTSPVVRRLVNEHNLDVSRLAGSGLGGRITREDVERLIRSSPAPERPQSVSEQAPGRQQPQSADLPSELKVVPLSRIRKSIGAHMLRSKATSPHVLTAMEVDFESVERVRQGARASWRAREGFSLTYLPFIVRAVCEALSDFPHINASIDDGKLVVHEGVHLAVAVDLDFGGLLAPVIRNAETKRLRAVAREVVDLANRARRKELSADEVVGGTFTITNPGQYGTLMQFPIINQPQVAILSTDGISRKPVVVTADDGTEALAIHSVGVLALAWDHRAFDGAYAAAFLSRLRSIITTRDWEAELK